MYQPLAKYYDVLVKDDNATQMWLDFFNQHQAGKTILELASGTGEITLALADGFLIDASDISKSMLNEVKNKDSNNKINDYLILDMENFSLNKKYDNIICFCDSINYLLDYQSLNAMFLSVYNHLNTDGVFMFDMHSLDRLKEFEQDYIETGNILNTDYQWSISTDGKYIYHHFAFYKDSGLVQEQHVQRVFKPELVIDLLEKMGFKIEVFTDFNKVGIVAGEKIFIVGRKI